MQIEQVAPFADLDADLAERPAQVGIHDEDLLVRLVDRHGVAKPAVEFSLVIRQLEPGPDEVALVVAAEVAHEDTVD